MREKMPKSLLFLVIGLLVRALGLPSGAPPETCLDLKPRHPGSSLQSSYPPYEVLPAGGQGRVRLILGSPEGLAYEGFMILARDIDTGEYVGEFANLPDSARIVECTQGVKVFSITILISATFAQDYSTYWVGVESPRVVIDKRSIKLLTPATPIPTFRTTTPPYYSRTVSYA
ncbi:hypothetical protein P5V15_010036, partial [Pogonomyrmex californicus]